MDGGVRGCVRGLYISGAAVDSTWLAERAQSIERAKFED